MAGTLVANTINTDTGLFSTQNAYLGIAKAWLYATWNGTTMTVNTSFNISSITRTSSGFYTVVMATAMPSAFYSVVGLGVYSSTYPNPVVWQNITTAPTSTTFYIMTTNGVFASTDPAGLALAVFSS